MLPILRIVPVGGVLLAILILVLALTPPDGSHRLLSSPAVTARGPLLDRDDHPEWRQFLMRAALRRADELNRLRELPDTPVRIDPVVPDSETLNEPELPAPAEPAASAGSTTQENTTLENVTPEDAPSGNVTPADAQTENVQPETMAPDVAPPAMAPPAVAEPAVAPADPTDDTPKLFAGLPADRGNADPAPDDVTGSIDASPGATIPIDIGETSSTELPIVLPEERPPVIRTPERVKPAHESRRRRARRVRHVKVEPPLPPPLNFFEMIFGRINTLPPPAPAPVVARKSAPKTKSAAKPVAQIRAQAAN